MMNGTATKRPCRKGEEMRYVVKTIKVELAVSDVGEQITASADAAQVLRAIYQGLDVDQEHFTLLALNGAHKVVGFKVLFSGGQTNTTIDPKIVYRTALLMGARSIIVAHNHPNDVLRPSPADQSLTKTLVKASNVLDIKLLDHIILGQDNHFSFADNGLL